MALPVQPAQGMAWSLLRAGSYVFQATCDLTTYSVVPFLATGAIPQSVIGGSGQVAAHEMGIDNTGNSKSVSVMVGKLYTQSVPPYTQTTIELGDTAPMVQVTGGGVCLVTFSTTTVPGTEAATNPYAASVAALGLFLPAGSVIMYAGPPGNIPTGWQLCDGSALSRANQPALYGAIGTLYGQGDGSSTFNVPDLRGKFARGFDNGANVDSGRVLGSLQTSQVGAHQHPVPISIGGNSLIMTCDGNGNPDSGYISQPNVTFDYSGGGITRSTGAVNRALSSAQQAATTDTYPINVTMNYIIKL